MIITEQYRQLARYNIWMNQKLYALAATIDDGERRCEPGGTDFMTFLWGRMNQQAKA